MLCFNKALFKYGLCRSIKALHEMNRLGSYLLLRSETGIKKSTCTITHLFICYYWHAILTLIHSGKCFIYVDVHHHGNTWMREPPSVSNQYLWNPGVASSSIEVWGSIDCLESRLKKPVRLLDFLLESILKDLLLVSGYETIIEDCCWCGHCCCCCCWGKVLKHGRNRKKKHKRDTHTNH